MNNGKLDTRTVSPATTQTEILISANPKNDLNESVIKVMEDFGIKRSTTIHAILQKTHNGISACYYLLKQSMKDSGDLVPDEPIVRKTINGEKASPTQGKSIRPLSAPAGRVKKAAPVEGENPAADDNNDDDSFIQDDDNSEEEEKPKSDSIALGHLGGVSVGGSTAGGGVAGEAGAGTRGDNLIMKKQ